MADIYEQLTCTLIEIHVTLRQQHPGSVYFTSTALVSSIVLVRSFASLSFRNAFGCFLQCLTVAYSQGFYLSKVK